MSQEKIINVARGLEPADLVIKNAQVVNVLSEEIHKADIAIADGIIVGVGENYFGKKEININGAYVCPAFIDGHVHLESSMLLPKEFAKLVVPSGTTTAIIATNSIYQNYRKFSEDFANSFILPRDVIYKYNQIKETIISKLHEKVRQIRSDDMNELKKNIHLFS